MCIWFCTVHPFSAGYSLSMVFRKFSPAPQFRCVNSSSVSHSYNSDTPTSLYREDYCSNSGVSKPQLRDQIWPLIQPSSFPSFSGLKITQKIHLSWQKRALSKANITEKWRLARETIGDWGSLLNPYLEQGRSH